MQSIPSTARFHVFKETAFQGLAYCDYCQRLLWGLARRGVQCTECGYQCHQPCSDKVVRCRSPKRHCADALSSATESETDSRYSASSPRSVDVHETLRSPPLLQPPPSSGRHSASSTTSKAYQKALRQHVHGSMTQQHRGTLGHDTDEVSPHTFTKAFMRSISRARPLFDMMDMMHDVYVWKYPWKSFVCLVGWVLFCLFPVTRLCIPMLAWGVLRLSVGYSHSSLTHILLPRYDDNHPEFQHDLERTQQWLVRWIRWRDWLAFHLDHASLDAPLYWVLLALCFSMTMIGWSLRDYLALCIGVVLLVYRTWVGSAIGALLASCIQLLQTFIDTVTLHHPIHVDNVIEVSVYENQRWWPRTGFTGRLLRSERSAWSNITGVEPLCPTGDMPPPCHYMWLEDDWHLDRTGPWIDDLLGIGKLNPVDGCGY